jgi:acetyl esterase
MEIRAEKARGLAMAEKKAEKVTGNARRRLIVAGSILAGLALMALCAVEVGLPAYERYIMDNLDTNYRRIRAQADMIPPASSIKMASVRNFTIAGPAGEVPVRLYLPLGMRADGPLLIYMHGGGFVLGGIAMADRVVRTLARGGRCAAISVGYRLAPENPYPAGLEDCYAVILWAREHRAELGGSSGEIVLAGESAGGTLAAALSQVCRDRGVPGIAGQMLFSPAVGGIDESTGKPYESRARNAKVSILTAKSLSSFGRMYLGDPARYAEDPYVNPIRAASLSGLPPALIVTCGRDPLREEGQAYARKLAQAGVAVVHRDFPTRNHAYQGREVMELAMEFLRGIGNRASPSLPSR